MNAAPSTVQKWSVIQFKFRSEQTFSPCDHRGTYIFKKVSRVPYNRNFYQASLFQQLDQIPLLCSCKFRIPFTLTQMRPWKFRTCNLLQISGPECESLEYHVRTWPSPQHPPHGDGFGCTWVLNHQLHVARSHPRCGANARNGIIIIKSNGKGIGENGTDRG